MAALRLCLALLSSSLLLAAACLGTLRSGAVPREHRPWSPRHTKGGSQGPAVASADGGAPSPG